jgi:polysaccharide export outer membrane protein
MVVFSQEVYLMHSRNFAQALTMMACTIATPSSSGLLFSFVGLAQNTTVEAGSQLANQLKSGDRIRLTVAGFPDLSGDQIILTDGSLQLPLAGTIAIAGQTPAEAVQTITQALRPYIRRPQVGLAVVTIRPPRISVTGEVLRPGPRFLTPPEQQQSSKNSPDTGGENVQTVSYALLIAGGIIPTADVRNIRIRRVGLKTGTQKPSNPEKTEIKVDLWRAIQTGDLAADPQVLDGDEIIVPAAQVSRADQQRLLASTIAPNRITVQVAGLVRNPGSIQIAPSSGASAAVAAAGGLAEGASQKLALLRMNTGGTLERKTFRFGEDTGPMQEGDVIVVSKSTLSAVIDPISKVLNPLISVFYLFR